MCTYLDRDTLPIQSRIIPWNVLLLLHIGFQEKNWNSSSQDSPTNEIVLTGWDISYFVEILFTQYCFRKNWTTRYTVIVSFIMKSCILFSPFIVSAFDLYAKTTNQQEGPSDPQIGQPSSSSATIAVASDTQKSKQFSNGHLPSSKFSKSSPRKSRRGRHLKKTKKGSTSQSYKFNPNTEGLGRAETLEDIQQMMDRRRNPSLLLGLLPSNVRTILCIVHLMGFVVATYSWGQTVQGGKTYWTLQRLKNSIRIVLSVVAYHACKSLYYSPWFIS